MLKLASAVVLLGLFLIFIFQNASLITVDFLVWELQSPQAVVLFLVFFAGFATGMLVMRYSRRNKRKGVSKPPIRYS